MKTNLIDMGSSRGICLPNALIEQAGLAAEVDVRIEDGLIVISSPRHPREGWEAAAREMHARGDDELLDPATLTEFDLNDWKW